MITPTLGLHLPLHYAHGRAVAQAAQERLRAAGRPAVILDNSVPLLDFLKHGHHPGFICSLGHVPLAGDALAELAEQRGLVLVNVSARNDPGRLPSVLHDNRAIGRMAAEHLAGIGCRSLAFIGIGTWFSGQRWQGFLATAEALGLPAECVTARSAINHFANLPQPLGILGATDQTARSYAAKLAQEGLAVPDRALLGVDDDPSWCLNQNPELSSVDPDSATVGRRAADLMLALLAGSPRPTAPILVPPRLVVERESTLGAGCADPQLAAALRQLRCGFARPLTCDDLAAAARCTRRTLERRFQAALGRSPMEELRRVRTAVALSQLRDRNLSLRGIARASGFGTTGCLNRAIKAATGSTPEDWRSQTTNVPVA